ncbi:hypothetical protein [Streptomyces sp. CoH27]|uniref:hypothetical protein n=1 Tax=Streptomyces sp. CoH27 TaxID=2875763 RepID=UPI001CD650F2|nr:hypothetical protein [Streptomyces sp. CoH27]
MSGRTALTLDHPPQRRTLVDSRLQQISLDAGLAGMEQALERLHALSPPSS